MNKKLSLLISSFLVFILSFYSCKKDEQPIEKRLIGTWELNKITFVETDQTFPLDSFRNVFKVNLTLNGDSSFSETEEIGILSLGPLDNATTIEHYTPRNAKSRYIISKFHIASSIHSPSFSVKQDSLIFKVSYSDPYSSMIGQVYSRKFNLKTITSLILSVWI